MFVTSQRQLTTSVYKFVTSLYMLSTSAYMFVTGLQHTAAHVSRSNMFVTSMHHQLPISVYMCVTSMHRIS